MTRKYKPEFFDGGWWLVTQCESVTDVHDGPFATKREVLAIIKQGAQDQSNERYYQAKMDAAMGY